MSHLLFWFEDIFEALPDLDWKILRHIYRSDEHIPIAELAYMACIELDETRMILSKYNRVIASDSNTVWHPDPYSIRPRVPEKALDSNVLNMYNIRVDNHVDNGLGIVCIDSARIVFLKMIMEGHTAEIWWIDSIGHAYVLCDNSTHGLNNFITGQEYLYPNLTNVEIRRIGTNEGLDYFECSRWQKIRNFVNHDLYGKRMHEILRPYSPWIVNYL